MTVRTEALRPASFRGVRFRVDSADIEAGRRVQVHEYPQRDKPYTEDLGRATRGFSVTGFVIGDDYVQQANKLLTELEKAGPGELVHPWLGTLQVVLRDPARVRWASGSLGVARFELQFVEAGDLVFPSVQTSTQAASRVAADKVTAASVQTFTKSFKVAGVSDFVEAAAQSKVGVLAKSLVGKLPALPGLVDARAFAKTAEGWRNSIKDPSKLAASISGALNFSSYIGQAADLRSVANGLLALLKSKELSQPLPPSVYTGSRQQAWANESALNGMTRQLVLAQAVGASSVATLPVYEDVVSLRGDLADAIDHESLTASGDVYRALTELRSAAWTDLTDRARSSARLRVIRPGAVLPALVLSHGLYGTADRADEIVARNRIRHPGFVPPVDLKVLSS